jgi:hypothetical protein
MTALPGAGALLGGALDPPLPDEEPPEGADDGEELAVSLSCCVNGSLLTKRLKEASWPSCTVVAAAASEPVASVVVAVGC